MSVISAIPPGSEPFTPADLRGQLSMTDEEIEFDALIATLIPAARARAEAFTRRLFITQTVTQIMDRFPTGAIILRAAPIQSIEEVRYIGETGAVEVLDPATYKLSRGGPMECLVPAFGATWPDTRQESDAVEIDIVAGYGDAGIDVPADILHAMRLDIAHLFEHREAVVLGKTAAEMPLGARSRLEPHRVWF